MSEEFKVEADNVPPVLQAMLNNVERNGPCVMEIGKCSKCKADWWCFHPFDESCPRGHCGHRNASNVRKYLDFCERSADSENGTGSKL